MITALAIVGYFLFGLGIARLIFSLSVRTGYYDTRFNQEEIHVLMATSVLFWPITAMVTGVWGLSKGLSKVLTAKPPESPENRKNREARDAAEARREKRELEQTIRNLERELGILP